MASPTEIAQKIIDNFYKNTSYTCRTVTKVKKVLLPDGSYIFSEIKYKVKAKYLGNGVYEISTIEENEE